MELLTEQERRLYLLLSKTAYSIKEIATILDIGEQHARVLLSNLRKKVKVFYTVKLGDARVRLYYV